MRVFIALLVLIFSFQSWTKADDIRDFEIEGMSIGDSALEYFSENDIKKYSKNYFKKKEYTPVEPANKSSYNTYDYVDFSFKTKDKKYLIVRLSGAILFKKNEIENCLKMQKKIVEEISLVVNKKKAIIYNKPYLGDESNKSRHHQAIYWLDTGDAIDVSCYDYDKSFNSTNHLAVRVALKEYVDFLNSNPY